MMNVRVLAKAIVGPVFGLLGAVATWVATGHLDQHSLIFFGAGLLGGLVTYFVPNAGPEVQAVETLFSPVTAGHPDPVPSGIPVTSSAGVVIESPTVVPPVAS